LSDYKDIVNSYHAAFGNYEILDDSIRLVSQFSFKPHFTDKEKNWAFEIREDTLKLVNKNHFQQFVKQP
jgi:hypothetical protein